MKNILNSEVSPKKSIELSIQGQLSEQKLNSRNTSDVSSFKKEYWQIKHKISYTLETILLKPILFSVFVLARFRFIRQIYSLLTRRLPAGYALRSTVKVVSNSVSLFPEIDTTAVVDTLQKDGVCLDFSLPPDILESILARTRLENCFAGGRTNLGFKISAKHSIDRIHSQPFYIARYFNISSSWPEISQLANDPKVREIATDYIGHRAKYTGASLFWTFPIRGISCDRDQQNFKYFHYDIDDFASLRFCFYLSEVDDESGPHICIRGSHVKKSIRHVLNFFTRIQSEENLQKFYPREQFAVIKGKSGYGFIEDTFCFHRGLAPKSKPRLFLQLHFAAHNYNDTEYLDDREPNTLKHFQ